MEKRRILIVDDEEGMLEVCVDTLSRLTDVSIMTESDSQKGAELLRNTTFDLLITDLKMPKVSGMDLLKIAKETNPDIHMLLITAFPTVETAVESMQLGAFDYLAKPIDPISLLSTVQRVLEQGRLQVENRLLSRYIERPFLFDDMIGSGAKMREIFGLIDQVAKTNAGVLIQGESGTGKELVARSIHKRSKRADKRFFPVDCGAIPENLLENEFFGHEKGAFTGAETKNPGLLDYANLGTLFLDEVIELPTTLQAKLLRVLQERVYRRIGGNEEIEIDIRLIAATNRDITQEITSGRFREDLYYRLNVVEIKIPPLRARKDDIPHLVNYFMERFSQELEIENPRIDDEALDVLLCYQWPGNIRELQNILKRIMILADHAPLIVEDIPDDILINVEGKDGKVGNFFNLRSQRISEFEKDYLATLLLKYQGNVREAASEADLPRGTFYRLMKKHSISADDFKG